MTIIKTAIIFFFGWVLLFDLSLPSLGSGILTAMCLLAMVIYKFEYVLKLIKNKYFLKNLIFLSSIQMFITLKGAWASELSLSMSFLKIIVIFIYSFLYCFIVIDSKGLQYFIKLLFAIIIVQAISPYIYYVFDWYQSFISIFQAEDILDRDIMKRGILSLRKSYLSGSGGFFGMAVFFGIILLILTYCYTQRDIKAGLFYVMFFLVSIAAVLSGRIAFIAIFMSTMYLFFFHVKLTNFLIFTLISTLFLYFIFNFHDIVYLFPVEVQPLFFWMFEAFISITNKSDNLSNSTSILYDMYYWPSNETLMYGDGKYSSELGLYYGDTDVGYMRNILFGGVGFFLLIFFMFMHIIKYFPTKLKFLTVIFLLIMHGKGNVILGAPMTMALLFSMSFYFYYKNQCND